MRANGKPEAPTIAAVLIDLLGRDDRPSQPRLPRLDTDQPEGRHINPRSAFEERAGSRGGLEIHDVTQNPVNFSGSTQLVPVVAGERDGERRRGHAFRLDDRQARDAGALELDPVDAHRPHLDIGLRTRRVGDRFRADGDRRRETGRLECHRQRAGRDQRANPRRLSRNGGLMSGDDLFDGQTSWCHDIDRGVEARPRSTEIRQRFGEAAGRGANKHALGAACSRQVQRVDGATHLSAVLPDRGERRSRAFATNREINVWGKIATQRFGIGSRWQHHTEPKIRIARAQRDKPFLELERERRCRSALATGVDDQQIEL